MEVEAHRVDDRWRATVTANGVVCPPEHRTTVFGMFERPVPTDAGGGSGMGPAIAERAVRRHGGDIGLVPAADGGSTLGFTSPTEPTHGRGAGGLR